MKYKKILFALLICVLLCSTVVAVHAIASYNENNASSDTLSITFYPMDHKSIGDSCIIRFGDIQILIDAGSGKISGSTMPNTVISQMNKALEGDGEKVWEYIIVTHGDSDHINALSTNKVFDLDTGVIHEMIKRHNVTFDTLIDFDTVNSAGEHLIELSSDAYKNYSARRKDSFNHYYTASELCQGNAYDIFLGEDCTLTILYNRYYDQTEFPTGTSPAAKANLLSVCVMLTYKDQSFLFTGDLEEYDSRNGYSRVYGETYLLQDNAPYFENGVDFFKAAHHGSDTSNSADFIDAISPSCVVISTIAGTSEYHEKTHAGDGDRFPSQEILNNFLKYTDNIYIPVKAVLDENDGKTKAVQPYYGEITVLSDGNKLWTVTEYEVDESGTPLPITSTAWFKDNRTSSLNVYMFDLNGEYGLGHCTLVKYGHIDILLDCGVNGRSGEITNKRIFIDDIKKYCVDGVIEYAIISCAQTDSISQMINDGIFANFIIENLVDYGSYTNFTSPVSTGWVGPYIKEREEGVKADTIKNYYPNGTVSSFTVNDRLKLSFYNLKAPVSGNENDYSICTLVEFCGKKLLFSADITENREVVLSKSAKQQLKNVDLYLANNYGAESSSCSKFLSVIQPKITVITAAVGLPMNAKSNATSIDVCKNLDHYANQAGCEVYVAAQYINGKIETVCGDIKVEIIEKNGRVVVDQSKNGLIVTYNGNNNYRGIENTEWYKKASAA